MPTTEITNRFRKFRKESYPKFRSLFERLATEGQAPDALVISCCDSRVSPSQLLSAQPGDLFVLRNVANMVPPFAPDSAHHGTASAIEYAVRFLKIRHVVIMGHAGCGGIEALLDDHEDIREGSDFLHQWVSLGAAAKAKVLDTKENCSRAEQLRALEEANIEFGLQNLLSYPWLKERVDAGGLTLHGLRFDIAHAAMTEFSPETGAFKAVE